MLKLEIIQTRIAAKQENREYLHRFLYVHLVACCFCRILDRGMQLVEECKWLREKLLAISILKASLCIPAATPPRAQPQPRPD